MPIKPLLQTVCITVWNSEAGDIKYKDLNNDGQIDAYDQTYISRGDVPTTVYGFGFTVGWKDLSVGMMFQGVAGANVF